MYVRAEEPDATLWSCIKKMEETCNITKTMKENYRSGTPFLYLPTCFGLFSGKFIPYGIDTEIISRKVVP